MITKSKNMAWDIVAHRSAAVEMTIELTEKGIQTMDEIIPWEQIIQAMVDLKLLDNINHKTSYCPLCNQKLGMYYRSSEGKE